MVIFSKEGKISNQQDKTNIKLNFNVPQGIECLTVKYSYNPKTVDDTAIANKIISEGIKKYNINFANVEAFLPVKNLVTLSFDENGSYRGACHRQPNEQTIKIAEKNSTAGIINRKIEAGEWDVVLNVHFAGCTINYSIEIEGE
jgi:hypothetical protein